jgi:hypothetical protein
VLNQTLDFLFSERGAFIRDNLVNEIVKGVDALGQNALHNVTHALRDRVGLAVNGTPGKTTEQEQTLDHIKRVWNILQETPGFDPAYLAPQIPQLLLKPEVQHIGQQVASRLAQRAIARLIREVLVSPEAPSKNGKRTLLPTN